MIGEYFLESSYIVASVLFILGLKMLSHPDTARKGNLWAALGMTLAIFTTIFFHEGIHNVLWIFGGILLGTVIGWMMAVKVQMTAMPQMVSFFNGMGGGCAALISLREFPNIEASGSMMNGESLIILLGLMIGTVSFSGSMIALGKLNGNIKDIRVPFMQYINTLVLLSLVSLAVYIMMQTTPVNTLLYGLFALALVYGFLFVMPIGGADMPVVISLLNSFTGVAAACGGFLYNNQAMITGGILVGSAGAILTILMCKAMNRSLVNVLLGAFGGGGTAVDKERGSVKEITITDAAILLSYSHKVIIVPGYGLAVAKAQHSCHELEKLLEKKGVEVKYAIHPVAGRMPGHMNVLLAEADVPYPKLAEMEEANPQMATTDVAIVIGANDVVNPAAETDPSSPIYGMQIIKVLDAKNIIVMKRSMGKGYAGIENELFFHDKTRMLFGDAKDSLQSLVNEVRSI
ncbi:NAD(P)(+) transhydrogenase (Re/Si-specific) subunit beta [candidate division TA06 bacterium]|nr:NAD(P)(+) transhydrogenase (Re/Si-specific) subunit beta [candidate division TA06 bacterium]